MLQFGQASTSCLDELVKPVEKNSQNLKEYSLKNKEPKKKKTVHNYELG